MPETMTSHSLAAPQPKDYIMAIAPYVPGRATTDGGTKAIKLSANENPLGCSPQAAAAFGATQADLARYPDAGAGALRDAIAKAHGLEAERIIYGTGSDEVLHLAAGAFAGVGDEVIYVRYGFAVYDIAARRVGATPIVAPDLDYGTDVDAILAAITDKTRVIYLANPNNPTGTYTTRADIARLHAAIRPDILLVIDQAYAEYLDADQDDGALELARAHSNVLITRTFSKIYGLAAERIGWGYAHPALIDAMHRIRAPFNVTIAGQAAAIAALSDQDFVAQSRTANAAGRAQLNADIAALGNAGLRAIPSACNFVLVLFEGAITAETAYKGLMAAGYITRWLPGQGLPNALRITIGTEDEMAGMMAALRQIIAA
jgi:histidinol-phosphate aminotransferase